MNRENYIADRNRLFTVDAPTPELSVPFLGGPVPGPYFGPGGGTEGFLRTMKRKPLSKSVRFSIFARDGFKCRYCGATSEQVELVVDHIVPASKGGGDETENLVTACFGCNAGKGAKLLHQAIPSEVEPLRRAQELQEQKARFRKLKAIRRKDERLRQELVNFWASTLGQNGMHAMTGQVLLSYCRKYGKELVFMWIEQAYAAVGYRGETAVGKYVSGMRRRLVEEGEIEQ